MKTTGLYTDAITNGLVIRNKIGEVVADATTTEAADRIVKCLNTHDALIEALREAMDAACELGTFGKELNTKWAKLLKEAK